MKYEVINVKSQRDVLSACHRNNVYVVHPHPVTGLPTATPIVIAETNDILNRNNILIEVIEE